MAIKQKLWDQAKAMFEGGATLSEIETKTRIGKSTVSKKAKALCWDKGINQRIILEESNALTMKSTFNQHQLNYHDEEVNRLTEDAKMIRALTNRNMVGVSKKLEVDEELSMFDHKNAQDLIDKASITLGVNDRHAKPTQVNQTNQTLVNVTDDQLDAKIKAFGLE